MLVLTRKLDEAIRIGDDIKITVLRVKGNTVRIGIEAPREVRVVRDELETLGSDATLAITADRSSTVSPARAAEVASEVRAASRAVSVAPTAGLDLLSCEQFLGSEDEAVITTVVDSPQPSSSRLFVGRMRVPTAKAAPSNLQGSNPHCGEQDGGDQAAPLRAFLRSGRKLQAVG